MVNVAASLMSWGPFRKEFARWGRQAELFHPEDYPEYSKLEYFAIRSSREHYPQMIRCVPVDNYPSENNSIHGRALTFPLQVPAVRVRPQPLTEGNARA